jgi:hypothetical protein
MPTDWMLWPHFEAIDQAARDNVEVALSAYLSIQADLAYASMPITSGKRLYDALLRHDAKDVVELKAKVPDALLQEVIRPNMAESMAFVAQVRQREKLTVVAPAVFEAREQRWGQHEYMLLWLQVLGRKVARIHMLDGWEYSNGGAEEYVYGMMMRFRFQGERDDVRGSTISAKRSASNAARG